MNTLTDPLLSFSKAIGKDLSDWPELEELDRISHYEEDFDRGVAASLTLEQLQAVRDAYGDALTCRFLLGEMSVLDLKDNIDQAALTSFVEDTKETPTLKFEFALDNRKLLIQRLGTLPSQCRFVLYLFPQALSRFLRKSHLTHLETGLWNAKPQCRVIILVTAPDIQLVGDYLAVLGGQHIKEWHSVASTDLPPAAYNTYVNKRAQELLRWRSPWLKGLTPLHLYTQANRCADHDISGALHNHFINSVLLYTADRTSERDQSFVSTYAGTQQSVEVRWQSPQQGAPEHPGPSLEALNQLFRWIYSDEGFVEDRLPLVQIGMVHALRAAAPDARYGLLAQNAEAIFSDLKWHWKALVEEKVELYSEEVRDLESAVGELECRRRTR